MLRVFQLGLISCLVGSCLVQGALGCSGSGALAALTLPNSLSKVAQQRLHWRRHLSILLSSWGLNIKRGHWTMTPMQVLVWYSMYWCGDSGVRAHKGWSRAGAAVSTCSSPVSVGAAGRPALPGMSSGLLLQFFPLDADGVWETLWSAPHTSAEQKAELPVPGLHCTAILGWGETLPH